MEYMATNEHDLREIAQEVLQRIPKEHDHATVLALEGDLGAGKTTFVRILARTLGITEPVTSPTFVIQKSYPISGRDRHTRMSRMVHIDAYRLKSAHDTESLRLDETLLDPHNLVLIEWPGNIAGALPDDAMMLRFTYIDETTRKVQLVV